MKKLQILLPVALLSLALPTTGLLAGNSTCCPGSCCPNKLCCPNNLEPLPFPLPENQDEDPEKEEGVNIQPFLRLVLAEEEEKGGVQTHYYDEEKKTQVYLLADDDPTKEETTALWNEKDKENPEPKLPYFVA